MTRNISQTLRIPTQYLQIIRRTEQTQSTLSSRNSTATDLQHNGVRWMKILRILNSNQETCSHYTQQLLGILVNLLIQCTPKIIQRPCTLKVVKQFILKWSPSVNIPTTKQCLQKILLI
eukprot:NODE_88_length_21932_cov_0.317867.p15 type:complete len:119 gc:universal NODE_88_length_21932_cov_0.317867:5289-4933(-)